jgi:dUTP pyrophosphatase
MPRYFEVVKNESRMSDGEIKLPFRSDKGSAGYDFTSPVNVIIPPNESRLVFTDVKACMNEDEVLKLYVRSSMGKTPVVIANGTGIIDSSYYGNQYNDGNIGFRLLNLSDENYVIHKGDRIGQGVFQKYLTVDDDDTDGERTGGFGSSGK